jgi:hypothetical protein
MIPSLALEGGGDPEQLLEVLDLGRRRRASMRLSLRMQGSSRSEVSGRPAGPTHLRAFQRAQGDVTLRWLRTRLGDRTAVASRA